MHFSCTISDTLGNGKSSAVEGGNSTPTGTVTPSVAPPSRTEFIGTGKSQAVESKTRLLGEQVLNFSADFSCNPSQRADPDETRAAGPAGFAPRFGRATPSPLISEASHVGFI